MSRVYLAIGYATGFLFHTLRRWEQPERFPLLVAVPYLKAFSSVMGKLPPESMNCLTSIMLDSGAFTAWNSGGSIDLEQYTAITKHPAWSECVALDVIGDAEGTLRNAFWMREQGSKAYPVFHIGDPWEMLDEYVKVFPKVGLSCRFGEPIKESYHFYEQCFARHWPFPYHSFGWIGGGKETPLERFPFHSGDSSSWVQGPLTFGRWDPAFPGLGHPVRHRRGRSMVPMIQSTVRAAEPLAWRWRKVMPVLEAMIEERGGLRYGQLAGPVAAEDLSDAYKQASHNPVLKGRRA